jgi:tRNA-Thr(GGU) m(6)t(6)A37 methyltransferase TsaA
MDTIVYRPIGIIHTPFSDISGMPIQTAGARDVPGHIEIFSEYAPGLKDIEGFSHIILIYHFDRCPGPRLEVVPYLDTASHGVFSTRAPCRPNSIGLSVVRLTGRDDMVLRIMDVDMLDGTPVLDIKPYVPLFDHVEAERIGWLEKSGRKAEVMKADDRFCRRIPS